MAEEKRAFWFHAKSFGWGWGLPATWQGWLVFMAYFGLLLGGRYIVTMPNYRLPYTITVTVLLIIVIVLKGERPLRWRWGKD